MIRKELLNFDVTPSVVLADKKSKISIKGNGDYYRFYDDVEYKVTVCAKEFPDCEIDEDFTLGGYEREPIFVYPSNGVIEFEYEFKEEQEWEIVVCASPEQKKHLNKTRLSYEGVWDLTEMERGAVFCIYSLKEDLYSRYALKGDMHVHSSGSDGKQAPETVCAAYRREGYDYLALTDHHVYESSVRAKKRFEEFDSNMTVYCGEEVHNKYLGRFHVVNFGGKYSVNEIILQDRQKAKDIVKNEAKNISGLSGRDAEEVAWYKYITDEIRKSGGISIFAHPYWTDRHCYNCPTKIAVEVFKRGYFDAYEVLGGCTPTENNLQAALYYQMRAEGLEIPITGSTDSHSAYEHGVSGFSNYYTIAFAKDRESVSEAVCDLYSAAVECLPGESIRVTGPFRLVKYAQFLIHNYYPIHDRLCSASGTAMLLYFNNKDESLKPLIESLEKEVEKFNNNFFGRY